MCGGSTPKPPPPPEPPPTPVDPEVIEARKKQKRRILSRQGRKATILTGPYGVGAPVSTAFKTLLGQ